MNTKALSLTGTIIAAALCAGRASAQVVTISPGYASGNGYAYAPPAYAAPAPAHGAPGPSVTIVISPPPATYVAPAAPAYGYAAPGYYEARPVPPAPIPTPGYAAEIDYDYADSGYAYAPTTTYVAPGYASSATRACWRDSFGVRHCRWR